MIGLPSTRPSLQQTANPLQTFRPIASTAATSLRIEPPYGMTMWFRVLVPDLDGGSLGYWSGCSGLGVELNPEGPVAEGGTYGRQQFLAGEVKYPKVTLERAMTKTGSDRVQAWLQGRIETWAGALEGPSRDFVVIELLSGLGAGDQVIQRWQLNDAVPVSWTVPALSSSGGGIAIEKLTFVHSGFLKPVQTVPETGFRLTEKAAPRDWLTFECNPAKISLTKSREAKSKHTLKTEGAAVVDSNSLGITVPDLRLESFVGIEKALRLFRRWLELDPVPDGPATAPPGPPGNDPNECGLCKQKLPAASKTKGKEVSGAARPLELTWGQAGSTLPTWVVLKQFTMNYTRFTPNGQPSRAIVQLTLQEFDPPTGTAAATGGGDDVGGRR